MKSPWRYLAHAEGVLVALKLALVASEAVALLVLLLGFLLVFSMFVLDAGWGRGVKNGVILSKIAQAMSISLQ